MTDACVCCFVREIARVSCSASPGTRIAAARGAGEGTRALSLSAPLRKRVAPLSEGRMLRLETLIELEFLNSSFSSLLYLIGIRQTIIYRALRADSISINSALPPSLLCPCRATEVRGRRSSWSNKTINNQ